jgi:ureidoglycolate lyase
MHSLPAGPLDQEAFAPFGSVIEAAGISRRVNEGRGLRTDVPASLVHSTGAASPSLAFYEIAPSHWPVSLALVERHPLTSQMFVSVDGGDFLVAVAPLAGDGGPDMERARAFIARPGSGIVYAPGVWHLPLVALERPGRFLMMMWETGTERDCEERTLSRPLMVVPDGHGSAAPRPMADPLPRP